MANDPNSVKEEVVEGVFGVLKQWWVWATIAFIAGIVTGTLTPDTIVVVLDKVIELVKLVYDKIA